MLYRSTTTNFWFGCEGWEVQTQRERPTWRNAALNFLQKNFFLQLRLLFQFNQTLPQRSQTVHIRKQMNIRKVPLFLSSLPPPVFTCLSFYLHQHEFQMLEHMNDQTFALCIQLNVRQNYLFVFRKEQLGNWTKTKWVSFCLPFFNSWSPVNKYLSFVTDLHQRISSIILFETDLWQHSVWVKILMLWFCNNEQKNSI